MKVFVCGVQSVVVKGLRKTVMSVCLLTLMLLSCSKGRYPTHECSRPLNIKAPRQVKHSALGVDCFKVLFVLLLSYLYDYIRVQTNLVA